MCGIFAIINANKQVDNIIVSALKKLEYRGYDSAGIAGISNKKLELRKVKGKVNILEQEVNNHPLNTKIGIGHTRWATHGEPSIINSHPHFSDQVAVVHNGIIENYLELKKELLAQGKVFISQTDTEVIPHLITNFLNKGLTPLESVEQTLKRLEGSYSIAVLFKDYEDLFIVAKQGSPLVIGLGKDENFAASDALALSDLTEEIIYLAEGDIALIKLKEIKIYNQEVEVKREITLVKHQSLNIDKGNFAHHMLKEIHDQPKIISNIIKFYDAWLNDKEANKNIVEAIVNSQHINIIACGTSYYAGLIAKYWFESKLNITVNVEIASEFRYRSPSLKADNVAIFISQSGETADTVEALRLAKKHKQKIISLINVESSTMERESDYFLNIMAGKEIGVASTKAFSAQLITLSYIIFASAYKQNILPNNEIDDLVIGLKQLPIKISSILEDTNSIQNIAKQLCDFKNVFYIGRNISLPIALEGALKLKELSYISAEAFPAGELKHGPIALIDKNSPVIVVAPYDHVFTKTLSNAQEIVARGGKIISLSSKAGNNQFKDISWNSLDIPELKNEFAEPILYAVALHLLSYYSALEKGNDIDQPRNLAKSVTVE